MFSCVFCPSSVPSILATTLTLDQILFLLYHHNTSRPASALPSESKPTLLREVFLTRAGSVLPNPLSCLYVHTTKDCVVNTIASWLLIRPLSSIIGWRHAVFFFFGAGSLASYAYLFSTEMSRWKATEARSHYACTSNAAFAGFSTLSLIQLKHHRSPLKRAAITSIAALHLLQCAYSQYMEPERIGACAKEKGDTLENGHFIGGVCFAFIYSSLFLRTRTDLGSLRVLYTNLNRKLSS